LITVVAALVTARPSPLPSGERMGEGEMPEKLNSYLISFPPFTHTRGSPKQNFVLLLPGFYHSPLKILDIDKT
jgi:hypothetical protein